MRFADLQKGDLIETVTWDHGTGKHVEKAVVATDRRVGNRGQPFFILIVATQDDKHVDRDFILYRHGFHAGIKKIKDDKLRDKLLLEWGAKSI